MGTKPHLSQIQSTDMEKYPHLLDELLDILEDIEDLYSKGLKGIFVSYQDMVDGAEEVGFYKVIIDETFKEHPTEYYFDGDRFYIKYGLKSIIDRIEEVEDVTNDTIELVKPLIGNNFPVKPGDTQIIIPLDKDTHLYKEGIEVEGIEVTGIDVIGDSIVIEVIDAKPSTEIKVNIPEGSIESISGKKNNSKEINIVVEGLKPIIHQNEVDGLQDFSGYESHEFRFQVEYPVKPIHRSIELGLVHCTQGLEDVRYDYGTDEIIVKLQLRAGRRYQIIFYGGTIVADETPNDYLECNFRVGDVEPVPGPEELEEELKDKFATEAEKSLNQINEIEDVYGYEYDRVTKTVIITIYDKSKRVSEISGTGLMTALDGLIGTSGLKAIRVGSVHPGIEYPKLEVESYDNLDNLKGDILAFIGNNLTKIDNLGDFIGESIEIEVFLEEGDVTAEDKYIFIFVDGTEDPVDPDPVDPDPVDPDPVDPEPVDPEEPGDGEDPVDPEPKPLPPTKWEYTFNVGNAVSMHDLNTSEGFIEEIPGDLDMYGDEYVLYYLGFNGDDEPTKVPRTGFDDFDSENPNGGYSYISGIIYFETGSIGVKVYKLARLEV